VRSSIAVALLVAGTAHGEPMSADDLARKNTGGYVTGLPLATYTTDLGFGVGARVYYYYNGDRDDPRFKTTPYLYRVFLQGFASTNGVQFHWLDFDAPRILDTPYRVRAQLIYQRVINQNYFGQGTASLQPLTFPGTGKNYSTYDSYNADQQLVYGGSTYGKYDQYDFERPLLIASIERLLARDRVRVLGGLGFSYANIRDYTGKTIDAIDATGAKVEAPEAQTRLQADCMAGKLVGCNGGWDNFIRLGVSYDTRDYEPDPNTGLFFDAALDAGTAILGSRFNYERFMIALRGYWSPIPDKADLVLAGRAVFEAQTSGAPFFSMDTFPFTEDPRTGLGGHRTMRGYKQDRFVGSIMTLVNAEVRWTFWRWTVLKQKLAFMIVPFIDLGRPYDNASQLTLKDWRASYGGALRIAWNLATIVTVDYGVSSEDTGLYINFNHIF
jgi:outer membrane protein assembly factor BamA